MLTEQRTGNNRRGPGSEGRSEDSKRDSENGTARKVSVGEKYDGNLRDYVYLWDDVRVDEGSGKR